MTELIIQSGKHQGKKLVITEAEITIGRDELCAIRLASSDVSRHHCALRTGADGNLFVRDLESRNGTFVNDVQITGETPLNPGDTLRVGPMLFQVPQPKPKKAPAIQTPKPRSGADAASDEDIASWLSIDDPEPEHAADGGDTTIIPRLPAEAAKAPAREAHKASHKTVAQEAADVIRKHLEMKKQQNRID